METKLAENIRLFRKQRSLTQEQLAEVLGVTVGAVHKWETKLSTPELGLITEMADYFETSVDVLLGYRMNDHRLDAMLERLALLCRTMDPAARPEAERILARYPNLFRAVYPCAMTYLIYGAGDRNRKDLYRSLELLGRSKALLAQNADPKISEATVCADMSTVLFLLDEREKSL